LAEAEPETLAKTPGTGKKKLFNIELAPVVRNEALSNSK